MAQKEEDLREANRVLTQKLLAVKQERDLLKKENGDLSEQVSNL